MRHPRHLLIATTNPNKIREIRPILSGLAGLELVTLAELAPIQEPVEDGRTFEENARKKALHYAAASRLLTVAEDSGLEIDALDGAPGVFSSRFGGASAPTYPDKFREIYRRVEEHRRASPERSRRARFVAAVALVDGDRVVFEARGVIEGELAPEPRGDKGFGYDPILFYPPLNRTLAELSIEEKARVSHRGQAFRRLREFLSPEP